MLRFWFIGLSMLVCFWVKADQYYIDPSKGKDSNPGTRQLPLKTLNEAARRVNDLKSSGPTEIILTAGTHLLTGTVVFNNNKYTAEQRLVIRAEINPDDTAWSPDKMPVIIVIAPMAPGGGGIEARGIQTEVSHATIEGIKFLGSPDYTYLNAKESRRTYPIWRDGESLVDLVVAQCLFAGDADVLPLHVGVIANGHGVVLDHCVFYNCKNPVVFWKAENGTSNGDAMRYCLVYGCYKSGVWTTSATNGENFDFHNNVIAGSNITWMREGAGMYIAKNSLFAGNASLVEPGAANFLTLENVRVDTTISVRIEKDQSKRNYLQLASDSPGAGLGAGLFRYASSRR
ncbi:MAG TPA: hypothetical protein VI233_17800 [Puia sp.]